MDWSKYPNFTEAEMRCKETGECAMNEEFMAILQAIRNKFGKSMIVTSGYRGIDHSKERVKSSPGEHTYGMAADIHVTGLEALVIFKIATECGVKRVGINQKGNIQSRYVHLGIGDRFFEQFPPGVWSY